MDGEEGGKEVEREGGNRREGEGEGGEGRGERKGKGRGLEPPLTHYLVTGLKSMMLLPEIL